MHRGKNHKIALMGLLFALMSALSFLESMLTAEKSEILKKIQKMSSSEVRAVLAFVNTLDSMNKEKGE